MIIIKKFRLNKNYATISLYAIAVIVISVLIISAILNLGSVISYIQSLGSVFMPMIAGLFIAYLLNPLLRLLESKLIGKLFKVEKYRKLGETNPKYLKAKKNTRAFSVVITIIILLAAFGIVIALVIPQLVENIITIFANSDNYINDLRNLINNLFDDNPTLAEFFGNPIDDFGKIISDFWNTYQQELVGFAGNLASGIWTIIDALKNVILGLIIGIYLLFSKELFTAQFKKIMFSIFPNEACQNAISLYHEADEIFINSIVGRLIDALIVGCICVVGCLILQLPYAVLFGVIIFVFNLIPFFGAFIGCIPCVLLLLLSDTPINALWFAIFVIILQNIDGNIISPRIIGEKTGLPAIWVLLSILIGGGFFGILGMLLGVPVCAVVYMIIKRSVVKRLKRRKLPTATGDYSGEKTKEYDEAFIYIPSKKSSVTPKPLKTLPTLKRHKFPRQKIKKPKNLIIKPPVKYKPPKAKGINALYETIKKNIVNLKKHNAK